MSSSLPHPQNGLLCGDYDGHRDLGGAHGGLHYGPEYGVAGVYTGNYFLDDWH